MDARLPKPDPVPSRRGLRRVAPWLGGAAAAVGVLTLVPVAAYAAMDDATQTELQRFIDVFAEVRAAYVEPVGADKLIEGAIDGMLASLDPHSGYLDARDFATLRTQTDGEYGGIGLSVTSEDGVVKVIAPQKDTPADRAGIKAGDYITELDGELIVGLPLDEAVEKMRGRPGTAIRLTIAREGRDKPIDVTVTREIIDVKPVSWEVRNRIGVLSVSAFSADVTRDLRAAMLAVDKATGDRTTGYVLDLRSNPGGLLEEAVGVSDLFLDKGEIVSQRGRRASDIERFGAETIVDGDVARGRPVIVLIDAGSASASEIVAGALQDHRRALVMGERSFGKGSVQTVLPLSDTTALRLTTARYYTPSGRSVQEAGIQPDIRVPQISDPDYKDRRAYRESDLRKHLVNTRSADDPKLLRDAAEDPRFSLTAEQLKAQKIEDFQLDYALKTLARLEGRDARSALPPAVAGQSGQFATPGRR